MSGVPVHNIRNGLSWEWPHFRKLDWYPVRMCKCMAECPSGSFLSRLLRRCWRCWRCSTCWRSPTTHAAAHAGQLGKANDHRRIGHHPQKRPRCRLDHLRSHLTTLPFPLPSLRASGPAGSDWSGPPAITVRGRQAVKRSQMTPHRTPSPSAGCSVSFAACYPANGKPKDAMQLEGARRALGSESPCERSGAAADCPGFSGLIAVEC